MDKLKIAIKNQYFDPEVKLLLCDDKPTIIYGNNGVGKSTISKALMSIKNNSNTSDFSASLIKEDDTIYNENEFDRNQIFVFNEDFVFDNIKTKENGINCVAIIGSNVKLEEEIEKYEEEIKTRKEKIDNLHLEKFTQKKNPSNIEELKNKILKTLKEENGYADRGKKIQFTKNKIKVTEDIINSLGNCQKQSEKEKLKSDLNELIELLSKTKDNNNSLEEIKLCLTELSNKDINDCLSFKDEENLKSSLKSKFDNVVKDYGTDMFSLVKAKQVELNYCPLCLRDFTASEKESFNSLLDEIFNERTSREIELIDEYNQKLNMIDLISNEDEVKGLVSEITIAKYNESVNSYNNCIINLKELLKTKRKQPNSPLYDNKFDIDEKKKELLENLEKLNNEIKVFNMNLQKYEDNRKKANELNLEIAKLEVADTYSLLNKAIREKEKLEKDKEIIEKEIKEYEDKIKSNKNEMSNNTFAIEEINSNLTDIFFSNKRLKLEISSENNVYYDVYCRGKKIQPSLLSTGERNAIALCYFYEKIKEKKKNDIAFNEEMIIIIDDPVTSLDYEVRTGIISFIRRILNEIHQANPANKIVVLTHELEMLQMMSDKKIYSLKRLTSKKTICDIDPKVFSNYGLLLRELYSFANNEEETFDDNVFNKARKVLEGFASFIYRCGFDKLFNDEILDSISNTAAKEFFKGKNGDKNFNAESHLQYFVKRIPNQNNCLQDADTVRNIIRQVIILLYSLNPLHVLKNISTQTGLGNDQLSEDTIKTTIERWCTDIF